MKITTKDTKQSTFTASYTVTKDEVTKATDESIAHLAKDTTIKGFRKGKAPIDLVKRNLDPEKIKHHTLHHLLDSLVTETINSEHLALVGRPQLDKLDDSEDKDWELTISYPLFPAIKLGDYKKVIKAALDKEKDKVAKMDESAKTDFICQTLISKINFEVPQAFIDQEIERSLSRLLEQTQALGLTIEKYLASIKKTIGQVREEYTVSATNSLKLEFLLIEIAKETKVKVEEAEINKLIESVGDEKAREQLKKPSEKPYLESIILKRKVIDGLLQI